MSQPHYLVSAGRVLLSLIFILSGVSKIMEWSGTSEFMASEGLPLVPLLLGAATAIEIAGGLSVLLGWKARWGAWLLFLYLIPTTLIFHDFWAFTGAEQQMQLINFLKNLSIMGGLLLAAAYDKTALPSARETEVVADTEAPQWHRAVG
jgi:putative oxidoreductase